MRLRQHHSGRAQLSTGVGLALVFSAIGAALAFALAPAHAPGAIGPPQRVSSVPIVSQPTDDSRSVRLVATGSAGLALLAPRAGRLTSACSDGMRMHSGSRTWSINGEPLLALSTNIPLWRTVGRGTVGKDVTGVQDELIRLGYANIRPTGHVDEPTLAAISTLLRRAGIVSGTALGPMNSVWIPHPEVTVSACTAQLGQEVADGSVIATLEADALEVRVEPVPTDAVAGARLVQLSGVTVPVDSAGRVSDLVAVSRLMATGVFHTSTDSGSGPAQLSASGRYFLATALTAVSVPPGAVVASRSIDNGGCLYTAKGAVHPVRLLSSSLGQSIVEFTEKGDSPPDIVTHPDPSASCP